MRRGETPGDQPSATSAERYSSKKRRSDQNARLITRAEAPERPSPICRSGTDPCAQPFGSEARSRGGLTLDARAPEVHVTSGASSNVRVSEDRWRPYVHRRASVISYICENADAELKAAEPRPLGPTLAGRCPGLRSLRSDCGRARRNSNPTPYLEAVQPP